MENKQASGETINITPDQLKELCPDAYDSLLQNQKFLEDEGEEVTPLDELIIFLQKDTDLIGFISQYPNHSLNLQDPLDGANVNLIWDGEFFN